MAHKFLASLLLSLLAASSAVAERGSSPRLSRQQQCRFQRLTAAQPSRRIQSEGGLTELWEEREDQFQCAGVVAMRNTLKSHGLSLPNYHPTPRLVFIQKGQGYISITFPGCAETYHAHKTQQTRESTEEWERKQKGSVRDLHQKVHRIRQGDIIAIPPGAAHWCYNDGNEELVAVSINDLTHMSNQLDQKFRQGEEAQQTFQNIFRAFDSNIMAEAFNVSPDIIERMQAEEKEKDRGLIVMARERMSFIRPDEEEEEEEQQYKYGPRQSDNGLEETFCTMKIRTNIENRKDADIYSRQAGKVNTVDRHKLPILQYIDMSAEKGKLYPNAMLSPDWAMIGHTIVYVTKGDAKVEIVSHNGQAVMNDRVNEGDMFVVPQYYASTARAGNNGFEWVGFKTSGWPMRNQAAGYTSVIRAMPVGVLTNAYQISSEQAQGLKNNRGGQSYLLSPGGRQYY
ncbi:11S globulin seed storage protein 2 [Striga asiatica]|uniref:11S globulin seed storage protein 2 n=1 Tax=Striga asiatica TaxID=4170 RepID=A0A5A7PA63_STRAF|nr:11S globulin seed storage protein 2 [Striga asiatica]